MPSLPELDPWQYRLSTDPADLAAPDALRIGDLALRTGPDIPCVPVEDADGTHLGALIGFAIDLTRKTCVTARLALGLRRSDYADHADFADAALDTLGGRFVWVCSDGPVARLYPDCGGQVPCVWDADAGLAGASAHALLDDTSYEARFNAALFDALGVAGSGWFPGGLTAHRGVDRLLPNHALDLKTWQAVRVWPRGPLVRSEDPEQLTDEIVALTRAQFEALAASDKRVGLALTAGRDMRVLMAIARDWKDDFDYITVTGQDRHAIDTIVARKLARRFGLRHMELPRKTSTSEERARFIRRAGHCMVDTNADYHPSVRPLHAEHAFVGGLGGEISTGFLWDAGDTPQTVITGEGLMARFGLPKEEQVVKRLNDWLDALDATNAFDILDIAYLEHRMAPWSSAQFPADPTFVRYAPLFAQPLVKRMFALPHSWKRDDLLGSRIIKTNWPELATIPINSAGLVRDTWAKVERVLYDPAVLRKYLRKKRG